MEPVGGVPGELVERSATDLARAIRGRELSSVEVVTEYLRVIESANPRVNAVVQLASEQALREARRADRALARGDQVGPLHGVPFTVKDVCETAGIVSAAGLEERSRHVPAADCVVVARMKASGAILLGKTNCPPGGGGGVTDNPVYGRTNNPYDPSRSSGGSSGGEAAAVAAAMTAVGIGSDSGGSIRVPAHFCGVAALKPTSGRVPNTGVFNHPGGLSDYRTQIGPIARRVSDLQAVFAVIAGEDGVDSGVIPMAIRDPGSVSPGDLRVAFYVDDGQAPPSADTVSTVEAAVAALRAARLGVVFARPTCLGDARPITERYWSMGRITGAEVERMYLDWDRFRTGMLSFLRDFDAILCPVDHEPAPPHGGDESRRFSYTLPFSLCGWPCAVVRAGRSSDGLPIGVQVAARPWREDIALAVARAIEDALGGWAPPG